MLIHIFPHPPQKRKKEKDEKEQQQGKGQETKAVELKRIKQGWVAGVVPYAKNSSHTPT